MFQVEQNVPKDVTIMQNVSVSNTILLVIEIATSRRLHGKKFHQQIQEADGDVKRKKVRVICKHHSCFFFNMYVHDKDRDE